MNYFGKREPSNPSCREEEPSRNRSPRHPSFHLTSCASGRSVARREDVDGRGNINWRPAALGRWTSGRFLIAMRRLGDVRSESGRLQLLVLVSAHLCSITGESVTARCPVLMRRSCPLCWCWNTSLNVAGSSSSAVVPDVLIAHRVVKWTFLGVENSQLRLVALALCSPSFTFTETHWSVQINWQTKWI